MERPDDFDARRRHLSEMSDDALRDYFWTLAERIVQPLVAEARTHTTPSIERSVLLRMGFDSVEARALVDRLSRAGLLGRGAGAVVLRLARRRGITVREAGEGLLAGRHWDELGAP